MIKKIKLSNFRSHIKTVLNLHPNVNVITGLSRSGKTSLVRALKFVATNRPSGTSYYPKFLKTSGQTKVEIKFKDKTSVSLEKTINVNSKSGKKTLKNQVYTIKVGPNVHSFKSFKSSTPPEVKRALRLSELNIQTQLEEHFAVRGSGSKLSKTINELTGLYQVDMFLTKTESKIRSINKEIDLISSDVRLIEQSLKNLENLNEAKKLILKSRNLDKKIQLVSEKEKETKEILKSKEENLKRLKVIKRVSLLLDTVESKTSKLLIILRKIQSTNETIKKVQSVLHTKNKMKSLKTKIVFLNEKLDRTVKRIKICPTCGSKLTKKHWNYIMRR